MIKHRHHIIPKHAGESNDSSNIVELSVADHAEAHRILFETFRRTEDLLAWKGLAGIIGKEEIVRELQRLGGKRAIEKNQPWKIATSANWKLNPENLSLANERAWSDKAREKRSTTFRDIKHQQGENNSSFGTSVYKDVDGKHGRFKHGEQPEGWLLSSEWSDNRKMKNNIAYGKKWYNDGKKSFLLLPSDEKVKFLNLGRLNPGFKKTA
jgi:hypothetical protein